VATTAVTGAAGLVAGLVKPTGLVTALQPLAGEPLPRLENLVFGGHDLTDVSLLKRAGLLVDEGVIPPSLPEAVAESLEEADANVRPGFLTEVPAERPMDVIRRVQEDLRAFRSDNDLTRVVVINVSSTEPFARPHQAHTDLGALQEALDGGQAVLSTSSLYAYAAIDAGCSFVDFTPSVGARLPALEDLARTRRVPPAGRDGKTGETLVKSALAPMFASRALRVRAWTGTNILGGGDGAALAEPDRLRSKLESKERCLEEILGYEVESPVRIDYVHELGEWKTAWDYISFEGFLGVRMRMNFIWEGCDSALAAPLVLDLARLVAYAHARGQHGALAPLAFFFKDPIGTNEHRLDRQFAALCDWVMSPGEE
jgi:myo-inositol-1-phosphate synthase